MLHNRAAIPSQLLHFTREPLRHKLVALMITKAQSGPNISTRLGIGLFSFVSQVGCYLIFFRKCSASLCSKPSTDNTIGVKLPPPLGYSLRDANLHTFLGGRQSLTGSEIARFGREINCACALRCHISFKQVIITSLIRMHFIVLRCCRFCFPQYFFERCISM